MSKLLIFVLLIFVTNQSFSQIIPASELTFEYFPLLKGKNVAVVANQTSMVENTHLIDTLISSGICVKKIFCPEHGFRGNADAGEVIQSSKDEKTGLQIISLYNKNKKPYPSDLQGIDIVVFDIQDVGVRFYTFISTLHYVMEACAENNVQLLILDRPNPNARYVDGPVLNIKYRSFVGLHPIPIVYGMTIAEYAQMINGEGWVADIKCELTVIPLSGYDHKMLVKLDIRPSPNLPTWQSIYLYPSLCLFEGTFISVGRGTDMPFQVFGHPDYIICSYLFKPQSIHGVSEHPLYEGRVCLGYNITSYAENYAANDHHFALQYLLRTYDFFKDSADFFNTYFTKLVGNEKLMNDVRGQLSEDEIRKNWEKELSAFMIIRKKYLLYPDFD